MANKIELAEVTQAVDAALTASQLDPTTAQTVKNNIIKQLRAAVEADNEEGEEGEEKAPRAKSQYVILVSDPNGVIQTDLVGWVLTIPEEAPVQTTKDLLHKCFYDFNTTKKGRKHPVSEIGEGLQYVPGTAFKEAGIKVKTKSPVLLVTTDNKLPKSDSNKV
jgi:hypothetical protein